ncbi:hypothetical protein P3T37_003114 [Kitasatospora sp. MAA4]|uniref:hypothetical protein n=1 Tax=Kitasatospora sp. MAA4 TaxID=3035093 RepID=UPI002476681E|nr:hypothetical protein [Kitasatospora sp. MAA4]MDH6133716.1 hypothetical protein [Kitasatospora sp. MAA4]
MDQDLYFDFYGVTTRLRCAPSDVPEALFNFAGQQIDPVPAAEVQVKVVLTCPEWPERGFFTSLLRKDGLRKRIEVERRTEDGWLREADHTFTDWSELSSPLPPFRYSQLWQRLAVAPGTCLWLPGDHGVLLSGDNYVGKTSAALALCARGARLVSDSLAVLDLQSGLFRRHDSPLGFRRGSRRYHLERIVSGDYRETVSPDTGLVLLARAEEFLGRPNLEQVRVTRLIHLVRAEQAGPGPAVVPTDVSAWFSGADRQDISRHLPEHTEVLAFSPDASPDEVADLIEARVSGAPAC